MDLGGSPPALGSSCTVGGLLCGKAFGNVLNHADFPKVHSSNNLFAGSALVDYKVFAYLIYDDPVKLNVIPDSSLPVNTVFHSLLFPLLNLLLF